MPVWLLATVGEEGLGNLRGAISRARRIRGGGRGLRRRRGELPRSRLDRPASALRRRRVIVRGPGGHAWEAAGSPSAIHRAAELVVLIESIPRRGGDLGERRPDRRRRGDQHAGARGVVRGRSAGRRSRRAGCAHRFPRGAARGGRGTAAGRAGGARRSSRRSPRPGPPARRRGRRGARGGADRSDVTVDEHRRERRARARIPAVALGITTGSGEHTPQEWIAVEPIERGPPSARAHGRRSTRSAAHERDPLRRRPPGAYPPSEFVLDGRADRSARLLASVAHRFIAARAQLLRLSDARGDELAAPSTRDGRDESA